MVSHGSGFPMCPEKVIFVIIDGLGDVTIPAFGDRTPLEVSHMPTMDAISGVCVCV